MINVLNIIGARPQIIKAAAISRAIKNHFHDQIKDIVLHTGQHYDNNMSTVFIDEMQVPEPSYNLGIGSGAHGAQTAAMIKALEKVIADQKPDYVIAYGDTNSTLAAAVASSKLKVPIAHVEAGLRSFNKNMPEEINRIMCDHVSTLLFSPTQTGINNLKKEGFSLDNKKPYSFNNPGIFHCGDVMYDNSLYFSGLAQQKSNILKAMHLEPNQFALVTVHRDHNTDNPEKLQSIFRSIQHIANDYKFRFIIPLHPRTHKLLKSNLGNDLFQQIHHNEKLDIIEPVSFFDMIQLEKNASIILTDSGGVQKEAYFYHKPCIILRPETEWIELVEQGTARLTDTDEENILQSFEYYIKKDDLKFPQIFGNGRASDFICKTILDN